jgi:hypothetical protein
MSHVFCLSVLVIWGVNYLYIRMVKGSLSIETTWSHILMHLLEAIHSWDCLFIACWEVSPWTVAHPPLRRSRRFSMPALRIWLWIYPLGILWRLNVAHLMLSWKLLGMYSLEACTYFLTISLFYVLLNN